MATVAYTVGRFQPPTIGHKKLINAVIAAAGPGGKAYVFVSSTQGKGKELLKNPLTSKQKLPILKHMFPSRVEFVDTADCKPACGGAIAAFYHLIDVKKHNAKEITLVVGDDRKPVFGPDANIWNTEKGKRFGPGGDNPTAANFEFLKSDARHPALELKDADNMSGTKARQYVKLNRIEDFYNAIGYGPGEDKTDADKVFSIIQKALEGTSGVKRTQPSGGEIDYETLTSADAEFDYPETPDDPSKRQKMGGRRKTRRSRNMRRKRIHKSMGNRTERK